MSETYTTDTLFGGAVLPKPSVEATLLLGQNLTRGAVLGRVLRALGAAEADPGNAGEGTIDDVALGAGSKIGPYQIECIDVGVPAVFSVLDPDGHRLADAVAGVAYAGEIEFEITAYGTPFDVGDKFTVPVTAGSRKCVLADSAGVDGRETLYGILAEDIDATLADKVCPVYVGGEFNAMACTFATHGMLPADDADTWEDQAKGIGIMFRTNLPA